MSRDSESTKRYGIIDLLELSSFCGFSEVAEFQQAHRRSDCRGIRTRELPNSFLERFELSVAIKRLERFEPTVLGRKRAVGNLNVEKVKSELGLKASRCEVMMRAAHMRSGSRMELMGPILVVKMRC